MITIYDTDHYTNQDSKWAELLSNPSFDLTKCSIRDLLTLVSGSGGALIDLLENKTIPYDLEFYSCDQLTHLPDNINLVPYGLRCYNCNNLAYIGNNITANQVTLHDCPKIENIPPLVVRGNLYLTGCKNLDRVPDGTIVEQALFINNCKSPFYIGKNVKVRRIFVTNVKLKSAPQYVPIN